MKNKRFLMGMLVMVLAFGMTVVSCKDKEEEEDVETNIPGGGTFTLTGIPATYNGKYAQFYASDGTNSIIGAESLNMMTGPTMAKISNGSAKLTLWTGNSNSGQYTAYKGNGTVTGAYIMIYNSATASSSQLAASLTLTSVTFTNGNATKAWSDGTVSQTQQ